jgi:hypothetical protein
MSEHPINLALRFFLEIAALVVMGYWGWQRGGDGPLRFVLALAIPLIAAALWGTFRVPGDPGGAPVAVAGPIRLLLEAAFFVFAVWTLYDSGNSNLGWIFGIVLLLHYLISYDRIFWLLKNRIL